MATVPPTSQPKSVPPSGSAAFRIVAPDSGEFPPNTDNISTIVPEYQPSSNEWSHFIGQRLGHFELHEIIGVGGMAAVFKARDLQLGRTVALKILPQLAASNPELLARFQQEARATALLNDEHVARVYFVGEDRGIHFIAFEYVEGQNLRQLIDSRGHLPVYEATDLMIQISQGLAHAVDRGVVHRDLKPSNIIIDSSGCAKIVDMGLARQVDSPADSLTQSGVTMGTYDYVAPEQAIDARTADVRSDIYSLGCTFYHALTGLSPIPDGTAAFKLNFHQNNQPADPRDLNAQIPAALITVLGRMMHKAPENRYQHPIELRDDLLAIANQFKSTNAPSVTRSRRPAPLVQLQLFMGILLASSVLVAVFIGWSHIDRSADVILPGYRPDSRQTPIPESTSAHSTTESNVRIATTVDELAELLREESVTIHLTNNVYEVPRQNSGKLRFSGRKLTLASQDPTRPATIRWSGSQPQLVDTTMSLLDLGKSSSSVIRGIQFDVSGQAAIRGDDADSLLCDRCVFANDDGKTTRGQGLVIESTETMTRLTISNSLFIGTRESIVVRGPALIKASDSAFIEPDSAFVVNAPGGLEDCTVSLEHCTIRLARGQAFQFLRASGGSIQMGHCLVAADSPTTADVLAIPALVRSERAKIGAIDVRAMRAKDGTVLCNAYFGVRWWNANEPATDSNIASTAMETSANLALTRLPRFPFLMSSAAKSHDKVHVDQKMKELRIDSTGGSTYFGVRNNRW